MTDAWRPTLRPGVRVEKVAAGLALVEPIMDRGVDIDEPNAALMALVDGSRTVAELSRDGGPSFEPFLRRLILLNLVEGAGDGIVRTLGRLLRHEERAPFHVLEETRFACQGSGECCQNYVFGPLEDEDVARIDGLDIAAAFPHLGAGPYVETVDQQGKPARYLKTVDERCIFLQDDHRCGLHARFGADAKPKLCRQYPFENLATVAGIKINDRGTCATFARSARSGLSVAEQIPQLRGVLPDQHGLYHPMVVLRNGLVLDYGHFLPFVDASLALVNRGLRTVADTLRAIARGLGRLAAALDACPLRPGEPEATIEAALRDADAWYEGEPSASLVNEGARHLARVTGDILHGIQGTLGNDASEGRYMSHRLLREVAQPLHLLAHEANRTAGDQSLLEYYDAVAAVSAADPEIDLVLRISLRQKLFGGQALVRDRAFCGLLRMALVQLLAVWSGRLRAASAGRSAVIADDLSYGHMLGSRTLDLTSAEQVLVDNAGFVPAILEALPAVARLS